jgi:hypothetical protein
MACLRNISVDTLHKGDTEDEDNNNDNDNNNNNIPIDSHHHSWGYVPENTKLSIPPIRIKEH